MCKACGEKRTTWTYRLFHAENPEPYKMKILPDGRWMKISCITPDYLKKIEMMKEGE